MDQPDHPLHQTEEEKLSSVRGVYNGAATQTAAGDLS